MANTIDIIEDELNLNNDYLAIYLDNDENDENISICNNIEIFICYIMGFIILSYLLLIPSYCIYLALKN